MVDRVRAGSPREMAGITVQAVDKHDRLIHVLGRSLSGAAGSIRRGVRFNKTGFTATVLGVVCLLAAGCSVLPRNAVPDGQQENAEIPGMPDNIRALGLAPSPMLQGDFAKAIVDGGMDQACDLKDENPVFCVLIISGGGGLGAYGAGLLNGWTASGQRPKFKIVTGISTGSLIAPYAFLGPDWDEALKLAYLGITSDDDVINSRGFIGMLTSDSLASTEPLQKLIANYVEADMLAAIAAEHESGRRLYVATTNMDAQRITIWNMGAIAASGRPEALDLFRKILLASASIPIIMPPVFFDVEVDGELFDEMHADGGVEAQFFVPLRAIDLPAAIKEAKANGFPATPVPRMFVIRNSKFHPEPKQVERGLVPIVERTISTMTQAMGRSDLYQIFAIATARGGDFQYSEIPADFIWNSDQEFDGPEMKRLYDIGYGRGADGTAWVRTPPGLFSVNTAPNE